MIVCVDVVDRHRTSTVSSSSLNGGSGTLIRGAKRNLLELFTDARSGRYVRRDWVHFIWDGPDATSVATISCWITPTGVVRHFVGQGCDVFNNNGHFSVSLFMRVAQEANVGVASLPEMQQNLFSYRGLGTGLGPSGLAYAKVMNDPYVLTYFPGIPIIARRPVVVTAGIIIDTNIAHRSGYNRVDCSTGRFNVNFMTASIDFDS